MGGTPLTLLSTIQRFKSHDALPQNATHPFASSSAEGILQDLIHTTEQVSNSLNLYLSMPLSNPKLVSLLRQHSALSHSLYVSDENIRHTVDVLRKRSGISYGEDIPLEPTVIVDWCVSRLETWGTSLGMETFKDEGREGGVTVVLGGKVLVVDVEFSIERIDPLNPKIDVFSVKTSYAVPNSDSGSTSNTEGSVSLDAFLAETIRDFCREVQKPQQVQNPLEAARLGMVVVEQLRYLVMLDRLAARKDDGGVRWFVDVDHLCSILEGFAKNEGEVVASSLSLPRAPLDVFLLRAHALPLPYLISPSISFLTYISPLVYLSLLRNSSKEISLDNETLPALDIPLSDLRSRLSTHFEGATIATLSLSTPSDSQSFPPSMSMTTLSTRPTFPLVPGGAELEHVFPQITDLPESLDVSMTGAENPPPAGRHIWVLDFTQQGKHQGVVVSQSRMRDIELVVNPLSGMDQLSSVAMMSFGTGSWVDLLLNPTNPVSPERYTALYRSPTNAHPPLQLRLTAPEEPGFLLEKVPVHSMKEVWGILEVVREQCWLNEILLGCHWTTDGLKMDADEVPGGEAETTEEDLQAVLDGTLTPRKIPVNVSLPHPGRGPDPLFGTTADLDPMSGTSRRLKIVMTSPERPPMSGLVEITVAYDETRPRGISVEVSGAMGADLTADILEEICRRGGTLGLSGRVWVKNAHGMS